MDFGDIIQLIFFGLIFLSFFGGLFGRDKNDARPPAKKMAVPRPQELSQSGGQDRPRTVLMSPARQVPEAATHEALNVEGFTGEGRSRTEVRRQELRERFGSRLEELQATTRERESLEHDVTDMPANVEDVDPERHRRPQRTQAVATRRHHPATGGDVLRRSLTDPDTLERAFIVKEVLDRPLALRDR